ncbi:MAG TPA: hypothetical protein ENG36_01115 [Lentisphaerae bacterium]|nr:hypothetical protein [Lentisphaerota bacterium]
MPALRGWGWLADSVLSLQQQSSAAEEEEETESTEPETYPPLLSPGTPEGRSSSPFSLLAPESRPSTFTPVRELGTLSSTGSTNRSPLIRRPADTAADLAPRYAAESTPRSSAVTANHPPPETAPAHFPAGELPYSSLRPAKERTARLSRTEELLAETKQKLFGRIPTALPTARPQVPAFRPTGDFQSSAFRDFTRFRPSREPGLFGPSAAEGVGSGLAEVHPSASLSGPRTATGGLPGFQFTPQGGSRLKLEAPAYAPSHLSAQRQSADSLNRVHSGSKLIDKFLNLPEPEY